MKLKIFVIGLLIGIFTTISYAQEPVTFFKIKEVTKVVDGDTVDVVVDQGFGVQSSIRIRLDGYDAPETWRPKNPEERVAGLKVKNYLSDLIKGRQLWLVSVGPEEIYSRWPGVLWENTEGIHPSINEQVIAYMNANNLTKEQFRK